MPVGEAHEGCTRLRPHRRGPRQRRYPRARQHARARPAAGDPVLRLGPRAHARSLPDDRRHQHVDQRRPQPVPPADRRTAGPARPHRPRHPQPRLALAPAREREEAARGHALLLLRAQRLRRGDLPLGQPHPLLRAGRALRPHAARHALRGAGGAARDARRHRPLLPRDARHQLRHRRGRARAACVRRGRPRPASDLPRDAMRRHRPSTATTSPSISPTSPAPIAACSSAG